MIELADGRTVSNYSPEFVAWCEARMICRMPTKRARRYHMSRVALKRGEQAGAELEALVHVVWVSEFGRSPARAAQQDGPPADYVPDRDAAGQLGPGF